MARTLKGNLTGSAAQGHDDIYDVPTLNIDEKAEIKKQMLEEEFSTTLKWLAHLPGNAIYQTHLLKIYDMIVESGLFDLEEGSDNTMYGQLQEAGFGPAGVM